jgi:hypothetical protein
MRQRPVVLSVFLVSFALFLPLQAEPDRAQPIPPGAPPQEMEAFIDDYIAHLCFMVYLNDKIKIPAGDESVYRKAVSAANDFLAAKKLRIVLLEQVEKMKKDHTTLVEDAQNENMSVAQWLAQSLNADVYIQLDVLVTSEKRGAQYFAQANLSCQVYDASIPDEVFGSKSYNQLDRSVGSSEAVSPQGSGRRHARVVHRQTEGGDERFGVARRHRRRRGLPHRPRGEILRALLREARGFPAAH